MSVSNEASWLFKVRTALLILSGTAVSWIYYCVLYFSYNAEYGAIIATFTFGLVLLMIVWESINLIPTQKLPGYIVECVKSFLEPLVWMFFLMQIFTVAGHPSRFGFYEQASIAARSGAVNAVTIAIGAILPKVVHFIIRKL